MTARTVPTMPSFLAGQKLTATLVNQVGAYAVFWADPPMFRMHQSSAQSVPNATITQITMDASEYDTDSGRSGTSPYSYTIPPGMGGRWRFGWSIPWAVTSTNFADAILYRNGALVMGASAAAAENTDHTTPSLSVTISVTAGDTMAVYGYQATGAALSTFANSQYVPFFEGQLISLANP